MKWRFADLNTLRDSDSGYAIHLEGGTWFHPKRLRPKAPENMSFSIQLKLLRKGLQHIKSIGIGNHKHIEPYNHINTTAA
ncbi:MAG: hypothetical protein ACJAUP_001969 [Cellvibrionaceae bacterium]|jgi:hypothetical protein